MNVLSLFDGCSMGRVALEKAGCPVTGYWASEIDRYAIKVSQKNWPEIIQVGDVTKLQPDSFGWCSDSPIDLLIGGSPCQDLSQAGTGGGLAGERSGLFWEFVRLKEAIQPKWFFLENVKMPAKWADQISCALNVPPVTVNAADFSAQNRIRMFWTNIPFTPADRPDQAPVLQDILQGDWHTERTKSLCIDANYSKGVSVEHYFRKSRRQQVFRKPALHKIMQLKAGYESRGRIYRDGGKCPSLTTKNCRINIAISPNQARSLTPVECERLQGLPDDYTKTAGISKTQRFKMLGNGWQTDCIANGFFHNLLASQPEHRTFSQQLILAV